MRYTTSQPAAAACQARSLRIGRCARCHASVLAADEHYGEGSTLVHAACVAQPSEAGSDRPPRSIQQPRRTRRQAAMASRTTPVATAKL
jgi:hypothetical protein